MEILPDRLDEEDETFYDKLGFPGNAYLGEDTAIVTIRDKDPLPELRIDDLVVTEGDEGIQQSAFSVHLSTASGREVSFNAVTIDETALAGEDYLPVSLPDEVIPPGSTTAMIPVTITATPGLEADERFLVRLSHPVNATLADGEGVRPIQAVRIIAIERDGNDILLSFPTASAGKRYHVERAVQLRPDGTGWQQITPSADGLPGTGISRPFATWVVPPPGKHGCIVFEKRFRRCLRNRVLKITFVRPEECL